MCFSEHFGVTSQRGHWLGMTVKYLERLAHWAQSDGSWLQTFRRPRRTTACLYLWPNQVGITILIQSDYVECDCIEQGPNDIVTMTYFTGMSLASEPCWTAIKFTNTYQWQQHSWFFFFLLLHLMWEELILALFRNKLLYYETTHFGNTKADLDCLTFLIFICLWFKIFKARKNKIRKLNMVKVIYKGKIRERNIPLQPVLPQQLHHHRSTSSSQLRQHVGNRQPAIKRQENKEINGKF